MFFLFFLLCSVYAFQPSFTNNSLALKSGAFDVLIFGNTSVLFYNTTNVLASTDLGSHWSSVATFPPTNNYYATTNFVGADKVYDNRAYYASNTTVYATFDAGKSWEKLEIPSNLDHYNIFNIQSHPQNSSILLVGGKGDYNNTEVGDNFISMDLGKTFKRIELDIYPGSSNLCFFRTYPNDTVLLECPYEYSMDQTYYGQTSDDLGDDFEGFYLYPDETASYVRIFQRSPSYSILKVNNDISFGSTRNSSYYASTDDVSFDKMNLNITNYYTNEKFVEILGNRLLFSVENSAPSNVINPPLFFMSDSTGLKFHVIRNASNATSKGSLYTAEALPGTIFRTERLVGSGSSNVSTDNGISWKNLKFIDNIKPNNYSCNIKNPNCSFVVTGILENYITGTILATGHESYVDASVVDLSEFSSSFFPSKSISDLTTSEMNYVKDKWLSDFIAISNDGGVSWRKLFNNKETLYLSLNYGNVIVNAFDDDDLYIVKELNYTMDQGITWENFQLSPYLKTAKIVQTSKANVSDNFFLHGTKVTNVNQFSDDDPNQDYFYLFNFNFSQLYDGKKCNATKDLVKFSLNNGGCVNGARYFSYAKNTSSQCSLDVSTTNWNITECERCTILDYICAPQFTQNSKGLCVPDYEYLTSSTCYIENNSAVPMVLISGNHCKNTVDIKPVPITCQN
ncbi:hypothetical protein RNJ44_02000 [Nakaseomyces bracarensis]|uniref:VPS10 domain-containing protein n=1 Tax=Nakaseomyces bracarensis TaxID=273131 RepID=A0ABR4NM70_9SACH